MPRAISQIDGPLLRGMFIGASQALIRYRENLNRINVFPVPDGDTGSNIARLLEDLPEHLSDASSLEGVLCVLEGGLSHKIQGYSGAYLFLYIQGFCRHAREHARNPGLLAGRDFAGAMLEGARKAVSESHVPPREGTILTVMGRASKRAIEAAEESDDLMLILREAHEEAELAVEATREELRWKDAATGERRSLRDYGVVDAGALAFLYFLGGLRSGLGDEPAGSYYRELERAHLPHAAGYGFHAEFFLRVESPEGILLEGSPLSIEELYSSILEFAGEGCGLEIVGTGSEELYIHLHLKTHGEIDRVEEALRELGTITDKRVDDMDRQFRESFGESRG